MTIEPIFLCDWNHCDVSQIEKDFGEYDSPISLTGVNILLAFYECEGYEGTAFVLFEKDGQLQEVNAGHCSCYGLEGQWEPANTSIESLRHRMKHGTLGNMEYGTSFSEELSHVLDMLESRP